jgi:hypothetical protein
MRFASTTALMYFSLFGYFATIALYAPACAC